jgi:fermentation-respiration switch protein FrsA (DUF1100 family)
MLLARQVAWKPRRSVWIKTICLLLGALTGLSGCGLVDRLILHPPAPRYADGPEILKVPVRGTAEVLSAVYLTNPSAHFVVLFSHGTGADLGEIASDLQDLRMRGYAVFAYDYEGYGTSTGRPSEEAVYRDAEAAYAYVVEELRVYPSRIIVHGFSIGGAPSVYLASRHAVRGLVLESTFVDALRVPRLPHLPFHRFDNVSRMADVHCPVLIMHSRDDPVIGFWHAEALFESANAPKQLVAFGSGGHGNASKLESARYWSTLTQFTTSLDSPPISVAAMTPRARGRSF